MNDVIKKIHLLIDMFAHGDVPLEPTLKEIRYLIASYAIQATLDEGVAKEAEMLCKGINEWEVKRLYEEMQKSIAEGQTWGLEPWKD